jgi:hypothetical protein
MEIGIHDNDIPADLHSAPDFHGLVDDDMDISVEIRSLAN